MASEYAANRPWDYEGQDLEDWYTQQYQQSPETFKLTRGYKIDNGRVVRDEGPFLMRHPWMIPVMGAAGGFGASALAGAGAAEAGSAFVGPELAGAAGAAGGASGAAAGGGALAKFFGIASKVAPAIGALAGFAGTRGGNDSGLDPGMQALMNEILQGEAQRIARAGPVRDATLSGIYQFLPQFAQQGGEQGIGLGERPNVPSAPGGASRDPASRRAPFDYPGF